MRRTLVIHSLHGGGAEKTMAMMANHWATAGHAVTLITLDGIQNDLYSVLPSVNRVSLDQMSVSRNKLEALGRNITRVRRLRKAVQEAHGDHVISLTDKMNVLALLACPRQSVIVCERVDPRHHAIGRIWSLLRRWTYPSCRAVVVQTDAVRDHIRQFVKRRPVYVIPNCVAPREVSRSSERTIVAMGRLATQKGFDLLIDAFAKVADNHSDWRLIIHGDGPERPVLEQQIRKLGLGDTVELPGWTDDPVQALRNAQVFVLSSRYEGFPNALLEAMAMGLVPISFDCESGPREIIRNEIDGLLVPPQDVDALAAAIERLISNEAQRVAMASRAREVSERFSESKFFDAWDRVLELDAIPN
ncbi:MAG: glycosyltransferase family 4 protein [Planctomycetaceae bacterium]|nr:glycosyltransferase family 4 protein [Planctomycetaceae bacterium]